MVNSIITLDYEKLVDKSSCLNEYIKSAFGTNGLGVCLVKNIPNLKQKRESLLKLASKLASLGEEKLKKLEDAQSNFSFGWSHGKEIMNGKYDFAKGSFYNNPILNHPISEIPNYKNNFPEYGSDNIWPAEIPELERIFMDLGSLVVIVLVLCPNTCGIAMMKKQ